jgi:hypothetical protein
MTIYDIYIITEEYLILIRMQFSSLSIFMQNVLFMQSCSEYLNFTLY